MYQQKYIGVVIPAYNEAKQIRRVLETVPPFVDKIVVVDDASTDETSQVVEECQHQTSDRIVLIRHAVNQGVGGAVSTCFKWCRDHGIEVAVTMDADAQMDPDDMPALLEPVVTEEVDYAKGNRLISGEAWRIMPKVRYLGNAVLSLLTKIASGYWHVADSQCGYAAINRQALKTIEWDETHQGYGRPNDLLVRLNIHGFRVRDVPVRPLYNVGEESGVHPIRMIPALSLLILRLFLMRMIRKYVILDFHPLVFFYALSAILLLIVAPVLTGRMFWIWLAVEGKIPAINALALMFSVVTGLQFLLFAMWFDMDYNTHLK
ncbi:MAG: glycosyltransferase family 2 protein [Chloroflexi bacterium]|nr:glycosyltransferase family 2 protein [Chloroflexota bacterium]